MRYISTRGQCDSVSFSQAVATGLAPDGGLFLPESLPDISRYLTEWEPLSYKELTLAFFRLFATDIEEETLRSIVFNSYGKFENEKVAPLIRLEENLHVLELFHGPTLAFKDFALQLLGNLYEEQIRLSGKSLNVLGATSGDTGAAAIHGLLGKEGVNIFILYPDGRISALQERQMTCTGADNVFPLAIEGSFDDAQKVLKEVFENEPFKQKFGLSAVNSINLARIIAQCVYYIYAWFQLPLEQRGNVEFVVPTGNFGNVLAGWLAQKMGLPVSGFKIATNQNDILHRLFQSGYYEMGELQPSCAPSMDIQVASNFERFIYYAENEDAGRVRRIMEEFKTTGSYEFKNFNNQNFSSSTASDADIEAIIGRVYHKYGYLVDPHTACAFQKIDPGKTSVLLATAHPAKFPETIQRATGITPHAESLENLKKRKIVKYSVLPDKESIENFIRGRAFANLDTPA